MNSPGGTSGTRTFAPSLGELVAFAFGLCGVRRTAVVQEHMTDAHMAVNLMLADWLNKGVNLWQVESVTVPLVQGISTYAVDPSVLVLLDAYVTTTTGSFSIDRIILPISRTEYASYPNKAQQGFPTTFWMDRLLSPTVTLWPVPDGSEASLTYYALQQSQDANYDSGQQPAIPYAWLKAFAYGLAEGLAPIYAPERLPGIAAASQAAYTAAASAGVETAQQYISPQIQGYYRT
jgi:hypothetical protein